MSWIEPQPVTQFPLTGPFTNLSQPSDVTVSYQFMAELMAEPMSDLVNKTYVVLADGTSLVTADHHSKAGMLLHIVPQATWSNLPI